MPSAQASFKNLAASQTPILSSGISSQFTEERKGTLSVTNSTRITTSQSQAISSSAVVIPSQNPNTIEPSTIPQASKLRLIIRVEMSINAVSSAFKLDMEIKLLNLYTIAISKARKRRFIRENGFAAQLIGNNAISQTFAQITYIDRQKKDVENVDIEFAVVKDAVPLIAVDIVGSFDKVSLTEMKAIFGYTTIMRPSLLTTTTTQKPQTSTYNKTLMIAFGIPMAVLLVCLLFLLYQRWKWKSRVQSYDNERESDAIAVKSGRYKQDEDSQSIQIYSHEGSGNTHDRFADGRGKSWNEARGERYAKKSIVGLDRILPKHSQVSQGEDIIEVDYRRMKRPGQKIDVDNMTSSLTLLNETPLTQGLPGQSFMVPLYDDEERERMIEKEKYEKAMQEKVKLEGVVKKLNAELSLLTQMKTKEEQTRLVQESGVPQRWLAMRQAVRATNPSNKVQPLNSTEETLQTKADIEKWRNKERLRQKMREKMRQQKEETREGPEIETAKEQNDKTRESRKRETQKRNRVGVLPQSADHGGAIQQISPEKAILTKAWKEENEEKPIEAPISPPLDQSNIAERQRRVPSGSQMHPFASRKIHPYPDVLHMPTSHISKEVPGGEPAFHRDDDYDKSIQQRQRFTSEYQQQAHLDHPKQPVQHTSGRPKWHSGKVGVLPQSASPSPQTQRRAAFEAVKQQQPQNNQDSSKVATRVPGKAVLRGGIRHNSVHPMPSSIDQTNESLANPSTSPERHFPLGATPVDLPSSANVHSPFTVPIGTENEGFPVHDNNRRIVVQSANTPPSPSRLFMKNKAGDEYLNIPNSSIRSDASLDEGKDESYA